MWYGCTLQEMILISAIGVLVIAIVFVILPSLLGMPAWIGIILGGIAAKPIIRRMIIRVGEWKKDKPYGYLMTMFFIQCADLGLMNLPYVRRVGPWRTYRRLLRGEK